MLFKSLIFGFFAIMVGIVFTVVLAGWIFYVVITPSANQVLSHQFPTSSKIYSREGQLLYEIFGEVKRDPIALGEMPKSLKEATVAIEDKDFYKHGAVSFKDIARAAWKNYKTPEQLQGASTITQQYIKNAILSPKKTFYRKLVEAVVGQKIESKVSKDAILELYLNTIPYGRNAYGVATASREYYGKEASQLSLAESAYLAALPQAPSFYDPLGSNRDALDKRKNEVLRDMLEQGYISAVEYDRAANEKVVFIDRQKSKIIAPHFVFWIEQQLSQKYGQDALQTAGLKIYTSLDLKLQSIAEDVVKKGVEVNAKKYNAHNAGLVAMDPKTGQVLAMVGGKDYFAPAEPENCKAGKNCLFEPNVNVAASARQPGSSFKPITYLTAFNRGNDFSPASAILDTPVTYGGTYSPQNYDGGYRGKISIRKALAGSLNIPAVKILNELGIDSVVDMAHSMGITAPLKNCGLSLTLGSCEVKLVDHTTVFSTIAAGGVFQGTCGVIKAINLKNEQVESCPNLGKQIADTQAAYELISIMTDNDARSYIFGKNTPLAFKDRKVAAKTGTTDLWKDAWTLGFTPSLAVGVWAGNNDGTLMRSGSDAIFVAAPIWRSFMDKALAGTPAEEFAKPQGIKELSLKDVPPALRKDYSFTKKTEIFADFALPKPKPKVLPKPKLPVEPQPIIQAAPTPQLTIEILEPTDFSTITSYPYTVKIKTSDDSQIAHVEIYLDGRFIQTLSSAPFTASIRQSVESGIHTIMAIATDQAGKTISDKVSFSYYRDSR